MVLYLLRGYITVTKVYKYQKNTIHWWSV